MPPKGQFTITLTTKHIPKAFFKYAKDNDRTETNLVKLCIWSYFGTDEQVHQAMMILENGLAVLNLHVQHMIRIFFPKVHFVLEPQLGHLMRESNMIWI